MTLYYTLVCSLLDPIPELLFVATVLVFAAEYSVIDNDRQVFVLLMLEMFLFMLLILPLPFTVKRKLFTYDSPSSPRSSERL